MIKRFIMNKFDVGIDNYSFHRFFGEVYPGQTMPDHTMSIEEFFVLLRKMKVWCCSLESCFLPENKQRVLTAVKEYPGKVTFAWGHPHGFMDTDETSSREEIVQYLEMSRLIGASVLRIAGSSIEYFNRPHEPQIKRVVQRIRKLIPCVEEYGVKLALENHGDFSCAEIERILEEFDSKHVGTVLDTGNALRMGEDPRENIEILKDRVLMVHAKDLRPLDGFPGNDPRGFSCVPAGEGITDFPAIFDALTEVGFSGYILVEISGLHPDIGDMSETTILEKSVAYLRGIAKKAKGQDQ